MSRIVVAAENEIAVNEMKTVEANGGKYVIYRLSDGFYATQAKCPHLGAPLGKGKILNGERIQCKFHRAEFDIKSGKACQWANFPPGIQALNFIRGEKDLQTYTCDIEDGQVYLNLA